MFITWLGSRSQGYASNVKWYSSQLRLRVPSSLSQKLSTGSSFIFYLFSDYQLAVDHCRKFGEFGQNSVGQKNDFPLSYYREATHFVFCTLPSGFKKFSYGTFFF